MFFRKGIILTLILITGCAGTEEKSELLDLLGVNEEIADTSDEGVENTYDALTLLKRGEAHFVKGSYAEASDEFIRFLELHPFHRMAAFAQYRLAMAYFRQMNTNDRDPGPMEKALAAFQKVVTDYPQSLYVAEAREKIAALEGRQAEHDFYVGHFYYKKSAYSAAIARFNKILARGEKGPLAEKTLYYMGLAHYHSGNPEEARRSFHQLQREHPDSPYVGRSEEMLPLLTPTSES